LNAWVILRVGVVNVVSKDSGAARKMVVKFASVTIREPLIIFAITKLENAFVRLIIGAICVISVR
jgi:hypothetical protein